VVLITRSSSVSRRYRVGIKTVLYWTFDTAKLNGFELIVEKGIASAMLGHNKNTIILKHDKTVD